MQTHRTRYFLQTIPKTWHYAVFFVFFLGLSSFSSAQNSCESFFKSTSSSTLLLQQGQDLDRQFQNFKKTIEQREVLTGRDVDLLNQYFNSLIQLTDQKLIQVERALRTESLSFNERLDLIEMIQSVYQSYFSMAQPLFNNKKWRRTLSHEDQGRPSKAFSYLQDSIFSKDLFDFYKDLIERSLQGQEITKTQYYSPEQLAQVLSKIKSRGKWIQLRDQFRKGIENTIHVITESIGITSDTFPLRAGKMMNRADVVEDFVKNLQPMDILLDRAAGFKLSHRIIPGYYGHTGMYLGTKEQLMDLGLWNDPLIVPLQGQIEQGHTMLEAKRTGIFLRKLSDYMNTDSITALRQKNSNPEAVRSKIKWGLNQIGKHFDHTFDLEHSESFFCSKLVYYVFQDVPWPTKWAYGRNSIPPDFIASMALGHDRQFDPVLVYENGIKIQGDLQQHIEKVQRRSK